MPSKLQRHQRGYQVLATQLAEIGFISSGSLVARRTSCGKPGCHCQGDPPQRHGPYWQWSRAIGGKTISRRLNQAEANLYRDWITNRRRLEEIVSQMEDISTVAAEILLQQADTTGPSRRRKR